jgi:5'-nucleotidase
MIIALTTVAYFEESQAGLKIGVEVEVMSPEHWVAIVGTTAAICTTGAFVPQIVRVWRHGGRDLSWGMLVAYLAGVVLWLGYGVLTGARAVIVANAAATVLVATTVALKKVTARRAHAAPGRLRVAIDMDETIADSLGKHLAAYNRTFARSLTLADLDGRSLEATVPEAHLAALDEIQSDPGYFADLHEIEGSREVVRELCEQYEVFIASAAMEVPTSFAAKYAWLRQRFPFIPPSHIVFCGDKAVLDADYLIDDTPRHFARFRGTPVLFSAPHNRDESRYLRVAGWEDVRRLLLPAAVQPAVARETLVARHVSAQPAP